MNRELLVQALRAYQTTYREEQPFREQFLELLQHPRSFHRDHLPGHITGSAWILSEDRSHVLLTLHTKLGKWLQPGGHADGDENVARVAHRELEEETGLTNVTQLIPTFFDIDIHLIPARKEFPQHLHYDLRFLFEAPIDAPLVITRESRDLKWIHVSKLDRLVESSPSVMRMASKTINL